MRRKHGLTLWRWTERRDGYIAVSFVSVGLLGYMSLVIVSHEIRSPFTHQSPNQSTVLVEAAVWPSTAVEVGVGCSMLTLVVRGVAHPVAAARVACPRRTPFL